VEGVDLTPPSTTADAELLDEIRDVISSRATYGYRRTAAIIRRRRRAAGRAPANHKRVYRLMRENELLLRRHFGDRPGRVHDGKVITLKSDLRLCSDAFEVQASASVFTHARSLSRFMPPLHSRPATAKNLQKPSETPLTPHSIWVSDGD